MFNKYILDSDTFQNLNKRREVVKKLSRKMIFEKNLTKFTKLFFFIVFTLLLIYFIHHFIVFDHIFHLHPENRH